MNSGAQPDADVPDAPGMVDLPPGLVPDPGMEIALEEEKLVPYALFRFFDLNVVPGKTYRYHFRLFFANPNYKVELKFLERDELRDAPYLLTEWSDPSDAVAMPRDAEILVASVKPPPAGRVTMEPKATIGITYFYMDTGDELFEENEVLRGQLLNFLERELPEGMAPVEDAAAGGNWLDTFNPITVGKTAPKPEDEEAPTVDYLTESILLDMAGGERLPGKDRDMHEPGMLLLLDPDGNLFVKNELDDAEKFPKEEVAPAVGELDPTGRGLFDDDDDDGGDEEYMDDDDDDE